MVAALQSGEKDWSFGSNGTLLLLSVGGWGMEEFSKNEKRKSILEISSFYPSACQILIIWFPVSHIFTVMTGFLLCRFGPILPCYCICPIVSIFFVGKNSYKVNTLPNVSLGYVDHIEKNSSFFPFEETSFPSPFSQWRMHHMAKNQYFQI